MRAINGGLYFLSCFLAGTGWLLAERLPHGRQGGGRLGFLGLDRHEWGEWHSTAAWIAGGLLVAHLVLNWNWIVVVASARKRWQLWAGLLAGLAILLAFAAIPLDRL